MIKNSASDLRRNGKDNVTSTVTGGLHLAEYRQEYTGYPKGILEFNSVGLDVHPTQKPLDLCEYLIKTYTNEGDLVLDNCAGSFTTAIAAINTNRQYICMEKDEKYFEIGRNRIDERIKQIQATKQI